MHTSTVPHVRFGAILQIRNFILNFLDLSDIFVKTKFKGLHRKKHCIPRIESLGKLQAFKNSLKRRISTHPNALLSVEWIGNAVE